jgi:hypothetical protein
LKLKTDLEKSNKELKSTFTEFSALKLEMQLKDYDLRKLTEDKDMLQGKLSKAQEDILN